MAPHPPSLNDITLLKMLVLSGPLTSAKVEDRISEFVTTQKKTSGPGRYFLEKSVRLGWAYREIILAKGQKTVWYHPTIWGQEAYDNYFPPDLSLAQPENGHRVVVGTQA